MGRIQGDSLSRSYAFTLMIMDLVDELPNRVIGWTVAKQLARCGSAVGANLREADHAFSRMDFAHKCNLALKEADETLYWLCICHDKQLLQGNQLEEAISEADALVRILRVVVQRSQQPPQREDAGS
jgi:four helix bundle protein